ncbi:MAG: hypothetical protein IJ667_00370 [Synergistaceae bacterium]|nr:hypothetical protein [Synergistaceae bacterium]
MKKILLVLVFALSFAGFAWAEVAKTPVIKAVNLTAGAVAVYDYGDIKLHAYATKDNMNDECYVLESSKGLVILESTAYKTNVNEFAEYIKSLDKPVDGALLSYHPNGYKTYGDIKIYATREALASWQPGGGVKALTDSFVKALGDEVAADLPAQAEIVNYNDELTLAGIKFKILKSTDGEDYCVEIPEINVIYRHMMGSKVHNILPSVAYIEAEIAELKDYQAKGYELILTSHFEPEKSDVLGEKINYLEKVKEFAGSFKTRSEFIKAVTAEFPEYAGEAYVNMSAGALFNK